MIFSIIIPTYLRNEDLKLCLEQLSPSVQNFPKEQFEIIVTDDSPTGTARGLIEINFPDVQWTKGPGKGPAANRNHGASLAKGEWLIFLDDDVIPDLSLILQYDSAISRYSNIYAFEGAIFPDNWELLKKDLSECPINVSGGCFWSANICIHKSIFKQAGMFDENFLIAAQEDQDLYIRVQAFSKVVFVNNAKVTHPVRFSKLKTLIKKIPTSVKNWYIYEKKHNKQTRKRKLNVLFLLIKDSIYSFLKNILNVRFQKSIYHLCFLLIGIPVYIFLCIKISNN